MKRIVLLFCTISCTLEGFDTLHFFRPSPLFQEPRFEQQGLVSLGLDIAHGTASCATNGCGDKESLSFVVGKSAPTIFHTTEIVLHDTHNITDALFFDLQLPIRHLRFATHTADAISCCGRTGSGDLGIALGATINYEETEYLDYIDGTVRLGVTVPTSKRAGALLCQLPLGYNGHTGIFLACDGSLGLYDWITAGAHAKVIVLMPAHHTSPAPLVGLGLFLKADHLIFGLSGTCAYQYSAGPSQAAAMQYASFHEQSINVTLSYDFATRTHPHAPEVGFTWAKTVGGKHVFLTTLKGGMMNLFFRWGF